MENKQGRFLGKFDVEWGQKIIINNTTNPPCALSISLEKDENGNIGIVLGLLDPIDESQEPKGEIVSFPAPGAGDVERDA